MSNLTEQFATALHQVLDDYESYYENKGPMPLPRAKDVTEIRRIINSYSDNPISLKTHLKERISEIQTPCCFWWRSSRLRSGLLAVINNPRYQDNCFLQNNMIEMQDILHSTPKSDQVRLL